MTASAPPTSASTWVGRLSGISSASARSPSTANTASASAGETAPRASGRLAVRRTCGSNSRSAKSLITQPAERITNVPIRKITKIRSSGRPWAEIHRAQRQGHSSSQMPIGRSSRIRRAYSTRRPRGRAGAGRESVTLGMRVRRGESVRRRPPSARRGPLCWTARRPASMPRHAARPAAGRHRA